MSPSSKRGQVLVLFAAILMLFLAFTALVLDGGIYMYHWQKPQVDLDAACVAAAISESSSKDEYAAFVEAPITSIETVRRLTTSRTIPWDWDG